MDESTSATRLAPIVSVLRRYGVEFVVIGGRAETIHGSPRITLDTDLCYRRDETNLRRLADALREIGPTLRDAPPGLPIVLDAQALALGNNYTFNTPYGPLDLLGWVEPVGDYDAVAANADVVDFDGAPLRVMSLGDLIRIKRHINRPKDRESLQHLLAIQRVLREQG